MSDDRAEDAYRRFDYRRMIAWPRRIRREGPLLERVLATAPEPSVVDLGCGTGEHAEHLASRGLRAVGVDRSQSQIERARDYEGRHGDAGPRFLHGDFTRLDELTDERFGAAICLGNGLPHLDDDDLERLLGALGRALLPGAPLLVQLLNYRRILDGGVRHLPLDFRAVPEGDGEIVFLRLMTPDGPGHVLFQPSTLRRSGEEPGLEVVSTRRVRLRAWSADELETAVEQHPFDLEAVGGDMEGGAYRAAESSDLVLVARRRADG